MAVPVCMIQSTLGHAKDEWTDTWLRAIEAELGENLISISRDEWKQSPFALLFIASGGSEGIFVNDLYDEQRKAPYLLLTSGESNSLAASMEILAFLQQKGKKGEILHGGAAYAARRIAELKSAAETVQWLRGARFGCVGGPSEWLIASPMDDRLLKEKTEAYFVPLDMEELLAGFREERYNENAYTRALLEKPFDRAETLKALYLYGALKRMCEKYALKGVSVRCFDLLNTACTTGCLALALLNAEGIYASCEGDMPALLSMAILGRLSGKPVFMCNPSRIDTVKNEILLAHCTLPIDMPESYTLMTHYESNSGVALRGKLKKGGYTLFKTDAGLTRYIAQKAELLDCPEEERLCRTQIRLRIEDASVFLKHPVANHEAVCAGDITEKLNAFFEMI